MSFEQTSREGENGNEKDDSLVDVAELLCLPSLSEENKRKILQVFEKLKQSKVVLVSIEEHDKKKELEKKMEEIKEKESDCNEWIKTLKQNSEKTKKEINKMMDEMIANVNKRRNILINRVDIILSEKIQQRSPHIRFLQDSFQTFSN
ncbi:hypothetical protein RFI_14052, partial [Reticulomyxa filosa]